MTCLFRHYTLYRARNRSRAVRSTHSLIARWFVFTQTCSSTVTSRKLSLWLLLVTAPRSCWVNFCLAAEFPQQLLLGHYLCDFAPHSCWNNNDWSTEVATHWRGPRLHNIVVLAVADDIFGLCGSESTTPHPPPPPPPPPTVTHPLSPSLTSLKVSGQVKHHGGRILT